MRITPKHERAIAILANGGSYDRAAEAAGTSAKQIYTWMHNDSFRSELRKTMERSRHMFEGRVFSVGNNAIIHVQDALMATKMAFDPVAKRMVEVPDTQRRDKAAEVALLMAVRLANRYKELQIEGFAPPAQPLIVFPQGTRMPWAATELLPAPLPHEVEAEIVDGDREPSPEPAA